MKLTLLCTDYDVALKLRGFSVSVQAFKKIKQILNYYSETSQ